MIRQILPDAKKIGILYSTSEVNSETAIAEYKAAARITALRSWKAP